MKEVAACTLSISSGTVNPKITIRFTQESLLADRHSRSFVSGVF